MWGGRFGGGPDAVMREINRSLNVDRRLWREDLAGSMAHAAMLRAEGIVSDTDGRAILDGLQAIEVEYGIRGGPSEDNPHEDIHMCVEARLAELIGPAAGRLHTARSRNDQVATDFKLWVRGAAGRAVTMIDAFRHALIDRAEEHAETVMPGFTHLQVGQPVTLGHHLMAYAEMARRDILRFDLTLELSADCPLGSAALAGTAFPIDRQATAEALGFDGPCGNSIDGVSDRDFALDYLSAAAICGLHLSRLAEEIVIWASQPYGFVTLPDAWSSGSSIMPQKRNPDAAELVRAKAAQLLAAFQALGGILKGLPLAYAKDLQDDKRITFEAADTLELCLAAMTGMLRDIRFNPEPMERAAGSGHSTATDLADALVREADVPFREAHHIAGRTVAAADGAGVTLAELPDAALAAIDPRIARSMLMTAAASAASRTSFGGTAPVRVREAIAEARALFEPDADDDDREVAA